MTRRTLFAILLLACSAGAAGLDGRWSVEVTSRSSKGAQGNSVGYIFEFRTNGTQLTGSVIAMQGRSPRPIPILNGSLDGDHFLFTTIQSGRKSGGNTAGEWEGTIQGDEIAGKRTGGRSKAVFKGKRQSQ